MAPWSSGLADSVAERSPDWADVDRLLDSIEAVQVRSAKIRATRFVQPQDLADVLNSLQASAESLASLELEELDLSEDFALCQPLVELVALSNQVASSPRLSALSFLRCKVGDYLFGSVIYLCKNAAHLTALDLTGSSIVDASLQLLRKAKLRVERSLQVTALDGSVFSLTEQEGRPDQPKKPKKSYSAVRCAGPDAGAWRCTWRA
jgi:hypothetical protein